MLSDFATLLRHNTTKRLLTPAVWHYIPEDGNLHSHCSVNLISHRAAVVRFEVLTVVLLRIHVF